MPSPPRRRRTGPPALRWVARQHWAGRPGALGCGWPGDTGWGPRNAAASHPLTAACPPPSHTLGQVLPSDYAPELLKYISPDQLPQQVGRGASGERGGLGGRGLVQTSCPSWGGALGIGPGGVVPGASWATRGACWRSPCPACCLPALPLATPTRRPGSDAPADRARLPACMRAKKDTVTKTANNGCVRAPPAPLACSTAGRVRSRCWQSRGPGGTKLSCRR